MNTYHTLRPFSWDRLFRPRFMSRMLDITGLRKKAFLHPLNILGFVLLIPLAIVYISLGMILRFFLGQRVVLAFIRVFGWFWLVSFGVYKRSWYHTEVRDDESYIIMAEHFSLLDIPLYGMSWPGDTRPLSAREYGKVPIYGSLLRLMGTAFIDRRNTQQAIADLDELRNKMTRDTFSILVAPTGTRSPDPASLPFKPGVFHFSIALQRPIVPLYLVGMENLCAGKIFTRPGRVDVVVGAPIKPENYPEIFADANKLLAFVRERMVKEGAWLRQHRQQLMDGKLGTYS